MHARRTLVALGLALLMCATAGTAHAERVSAEDAAVRELLAMSTAERSLRVHTWRAEAAEWLQRSEDAVWTSADLEQRRCREDRRNGARRFMDLIDIVGPELSRSATTEERLQTAARVLVRTWQPLHAVAPESACTVEPLPAGESRIEREGPDDGLADLPGPLDDDPLTLGLDLPGRRPLRR